MSTSDLHKLAIKLVKDGPYKHEPTTRRVRGLFNGAYAFDTINAEYVWEVPNYPQFYIPIGDFSDTNAKLSTLKEVDGTSGGAYWSELAVDYRKTDRVIEFRKGPLAGLVKVLFGAIDQWFEEETPIYVHPKDPYKRISILPSTRHIRIEMEGVTIAETSTPIFLYETSLPTRYYIPPTSINWAFLRKSSQETSCPYKGKANYYHVAVKRNQYDDICWWYQYPTMESAPIAGHICFYNGVVDVFIDGVKEDNPKPIQR